MLMVPAQEGTQEVVIIDITKPVSERAFLMLDCLYALFFLLPSFQETF
jgi:hypothetical protein